MDLVKIIESIESLLETHGSDTGIIILLLAILIYFIRFHMNFNRSITEEIKNNRNVITEAVNILYILYNSTYNYSKDNEKAGDDLAREATKKIEKIREDYGGETKDNEN